MKTSPESNTFVPNTEIASSRSPESKLGGNALKVLGVETRISTLYDFIQKYLQVEAIEQLGITGEITELSHEYFSDDQLEFLKTQQGGREILLWIHTYSQTLASIRKAIALFNEGANLSAEYWTEGNIGLDRMLSLFQARLDQLMR